MNDGRHPQRMVVTLAERRKIAPTANRREPPIFQPTQSCIRPATGQVVMPPGGVARIVGIDSLAVDSLVDDRYSQRKKSVPRWRHEPPAIRIVTDRAARLVVDTVR